MMIVRLEPLVETRNVVETQNDQPALLHQETEKIPCRSSIVVGSNVMLAWKAMWRYCQGDMCLFVRDLGCHCWRLLGGRRWPIGNASTKTNLLRLESKRWRRGCSYGSYGIVMAPCLADVMIVSWFSRPTSWDGSKFLLCKSLCQWLLRCFKDVLW